VVDSLAISIEIYHCWTQLQVQDKAQLLSFVENMTPAFTASSNYDIPYRMHRMVL
jgi:hypothetical protein